MYTNHLVRNKSKENRNNKYCKIDNFFGYSEDISPFIRYRFEIIKKYDSFFDDSEKLVKNFFKIEPK